MLKINSIDEFFSPKIKSLEELKNIITEIKSQKLIIGLCHGGFDLVHPGHIKHFEAAKKYCNKLIVSTTCDEFISKRKGLGRPVYSEKLRAYALASLEHVDYVTIANFRTGLEVINNLNPDIYFKGPDFIDKFTPELNAEKELIEKGGGKLILTTEPNLSTSEIIKYIKHELDIKQVLLCIDRDGTLIEDRHYLGKNENWKEEIKINQEVLALIKYIDTKCKTIKIVVSNQAGIASNFFDENRVMEINLYIDKILKMKGINIENWQYSPFVDQDYVSSHPKINFNQDYIREITKRKPGIEMVIDGLYAINKKIEEFNKVIVIGDMHYDNQLAINLNAQYIDVKNKTYEQLSKEVDNL